MRSVVSVSETNNVKTDSIMKNTDNCKFCGVKVNLDDEGNTYADGSCAHEYCADSEQRRSENESDSRD